MTTKQIDVIALGTCYVDTNVDSFSFNRENLIGEEHIGTGYEVVPGGSAVNFCRLSQGLGLQTAFIGMAGDDTNGGTLERLLAQQGVEAALVRQPGLLTNIGFNITNPQGEHVMFVAGTANAALNPAVVLPKLVEVLPQARLLYMGGCLKLSAFVDAFAEMGELAKKTDTMVAVDHGRVPAGVSPELLGAVKGLVLSASYYFPSREEFCALWDVATIEEGLAMLRQQAPRLTVVVKDGENGAYYFKDGLVQHEAAQKVNAIVNVTGAGDSFNAGVLTAVLAGRSFADAVAYGCRVAAAKISAQALPPLN